MNFPSHSGIYSNILVGQLVSTVLLCKLHSWAIGATWLAYWSYMAGLLEPVVLVCVGTNANRAVCIVR